MDALHVLPLSILPLRSPGLRRARLVKNAQLQGVVELFSGQGMGSGQVAPGELCKIFDLDRGADDDLEIVERLSQLSSYDIYSLRVELRRLGIAVEREASLKLSAQKVAELAGYMRVFIRPLMAAVYGGKEIESADMEGLLKLFACPDQRQARDNLRRICRDLEISLSDIPQFLEDYGDVYLSLAYYRYCLDKELPRIESFMARLPEIERTGRMRGDQRLIEACGQIGSRLRAVVSDVTEVIEMFRVSTEDMWHDLSAAGFRSMVVLISDYQTRIGGCLCALHVKMRVWSEQFSRMSDSALAREADHLMAHMRQGLDGIPELEALRSSDRPEAVAWV